MGGPTDPAGCKPKCIWQISRIFANDEVRVCSGLLQLEVILRRMGVFFLDKRRGCQ